MVHAGYVVLLYQTPLLRPKSASCSRRTRHQKCCGTDGTAAALAATQPTQVRNCVSSHGAHRDIHPHMHRWLLGWHWNYEISQLFLGSQSRGHSWWDYIIVLKQILSYHTCSAFSKAAYSYIVSRKHRVESTTRLLLRIYIKPLPSWHSTGSISSRSCFHRGLCHGSLDDSRSKVLFKLHQISLGNIQLRMLLREADCSKDIYSPLCKTCRVWVGLEVPGLDGCGQGSADLELSSESCQQHLNHPASPAHFPTQPVSLWNHSDFFVWLKYF